MPAVTAGVAFTTARTLLNDDLATLWTDVVLLPKLVQAFRELEAKLRISAASIMRAYTDADVPISSTPSVYTAITDIKEPIRLWEKAPSDPDSAYVQMTEYDPLPVTLFPVGTTIQYWQWDGTNINLMGCSADRHIKVMYWRSLAEPTGNSSSLVFTDAEIFLAPRTAALAAGSVGETDVYAAMSGVASEALGLVIQANRGRQAPPDAVKRP